MNIRKPSVEFATALFLMCLALALLCVPVSAQIVSRAEYYIDVDPGEGNGTPVQASDGSFNSATEKLSQTVSTAGLLPGWHYLYVRARDDAGNWGSPIRTMFEIREAARTIQTAQYRIDGGSWQNLNVLNSPISGRKLLRSGDIPTAGLSAGRHLVEVKLADNHGTPSRIWQMPVNVYYALTLTGAEYQVSYQDSYEADGNWTALPANDGAYDGREEPFKSAIDTSQYIEQARYFVWARAIDSRGQKSDPTRIVVETGNVRWVLFQTDGTPGATLTGTTPQMVTPGADCTPVTANPPAGRHFVKWTKEGADYSTSNPLTVTSVAEDMTLIAHFAPWTNASIWMLY